MPAQDQEHIYINIYIYIYTYRMTQSPDVYPKGPGAYAPERYASAPIQGSKDPISRGLGPKYYYLYCKIWDLKPYSLGPSE